MKLDKSNKILFVIFMIFILITFLLYQTSLGSGLILLLLFYFYFFYKTAKTKKKIYLFLILAFTIRVIFILLDNFYGLVPYEWDTGQFHNTAILIKNNILNFRSIFYNINESISVKSYSFFVSIIYIIFGSHEITIRIVNAFIGVYIAKQAYNIALMVSLNKNSAFWVFNLVAFWPSFVLYTSINMRDSLIIFLTLDLIIRIFMFMKRKKFNLFLILFDFYFIYNLRKQNLFLFVLIILSYYIVNNFLKSNNKFKFYYLILVICFFTGIIYLIQLNILPFLNIDYIAGEMEYRTSGGTAYLESLSYNNIFDIIKYIPIRSIYFLFGPFVWNLSKINIFMLFSVIESSLFLILFIFGIKGIFDRNNLHNSKLLFLLTFLIIGVAGYASITANYGTAIRHKMTFMIIIFIFISRSFSKYKLKI